MKKIKPIARVIVYDENNNKVLLVRNKNASFWYAPGGTWEFEKENILECAKREVLEETGLDIDILRLLYVQEFHGIETNIENVCFETFWMAKLTHEQDLNTFHVDLDPTGEVEEAKWFDKDELQNLKVFPNRIKNTFWDNIKNLSISEDPFLGIN